MKCQACQTENAPGVAFCSRCSTPLPAEPPPGAGQYGPPGQAPSGDQYPAAGQPAAQYGPPGQAPSGDQYPAGGYAGPGQYGASGQYPPGGQPSGEQYPPAHPAPGQYPSGEQPPGPGQYPPSGQYPPGGQPSGEQYPAGAYGPGAPPPGYGGPPAPPGYGPPPKPRQSGGRILLLVVALVAIGAIVAAFLLVPGSDDGDDDEVVLEPVGSVQQDSFTENLDVQDVAQGIDMALGGAPAMTDRAATALSTRVAGGGEPGLYGGSRDAAVCNVQRLIEFLTDGANADKAEAWAGALGIEASEIPDYVGGLTAVRLRFDTRVTNHGFRDGEATPFQSLLQAGTAVLVDDQGVPRVKCNCGNPLSEPEPLGDGGGGSESIDDVAQNPGDAWDGLDPANVVTVQPADATVQTFVVVNVDDGALFERPSGSNGDADADPTDVGDACEQMRESPSCGGSGSEALELGGGNVQITLEWTSNADLDLHVTEPDGTEISYLNTGPTATQGRLDKDSNRGCTLDGAVENVFWPASSPAPAGEYSIEVTGYAVDSGTCGGGDYTLTIRVEGQPERTETGSVTNGGSDPYTFTVS